MAIDEIILKLLLKIYYIVSVEYELSIKHI